MTGPASAGASGSASASTDHVWSMEFSAHATFAVAPAIL